jgi:hypothetical protein
MSPSLVPSPDHDLHFVLCDFGKYGKSYVETDPSEADRDTIVRNMIDGQYGRPVRVIALNPAEGWSRDVSTRPGVNRPRHARRLRRTPAAPPRRSGK